MYYFTQYIDSYLAMQFQSYSHKHNQNKTQWFSQTQYHTPNIEVDISHPRISRSGTETRDEKQAPEKRPNKNAIQTP
jgi:hypothetical protein